jgi:hypothetical protein
MVRGPRNMLEKLQYNFMLIICAFVGVITNINQNARYEHKNNPPLTYHSAVFCDVTTRRHIPQDSHDFTKLRYYQLIPNFNNFWQITIFKFHNHTIYIPCLLCIVCWTVNLSWLMLYRRNPLHSLCEQTSVTTARWTTTRPCTVAPYRLTSATSCTSR